MYRSSVRTSQEPYYLADIKTNQVMRFKQLLFIVRTIQNTRNNTIGRVQSFKMLKQGVHIVTTGIKELSNEVK